MLGFSKKSVIFPFAFMVLAASLLSASEAISLPRTEALLNEAQEQGSVHVIVGFALPMGFQVEGRLPNRVAIEQQREAIAQAQQEVIERTVESAGMLSNVKRFRYIPYMAMVVDEEALIALVSDPNVTNIQKDNIDRPTLKHSVRLIGANNVWEHYSGENMAIAILDTGVDPTHPFFAASESDGKENRIIASAEACFSSNSEPQQASTVCPNGEEEQFGEGAGVNCDVSKRHCDHGTHVAGIVAGNNQALRVKRMNGVAKDVKIIPIQVFSWLEGGTPYLGAYESDQILGLEHVYTLHELYFEEGGPTIAAANLSLGSGIYSGDCDSNAWAQKDAIDTLREVGIATVISSGNDGSSTGIGRPACISSAISVGGTDKKDKVASYSNVAEHLSLLAPGSSIDSSISGDKARGWGWDEWSGTSMAAPHVTGCWALLKQANPDASVGEILAVLQDSGIEITDDRREVGATIPRIRCDDAIEILLAE